jgi:CHAD domain-containing protein/uncharacterized protein YjbK
MEETELRYIVPDQELFSRLKSMTTLGPLTLLASGKSRITDHYLDTSDQILLHKGWSCRLRHADERWVVTLKSPSDSQGARTTRSELVNELTKPSRDRVHWPMGELREKLAYIIGDAPLIKLVTLRQVRWRALVIEGSRHTAEFALDRVDFRHNDSCQRIYILECELLTEGSLQDLDYIDSLLVHHFCLLPDSRSKLQRALELVVKGYSPDYDPSVRYQPRSVDELLQRYDIDRDYASAVADTAGTLFTVLQPVHHLRNDLIPSLRVAALLHDTGRNFSKKSHQDLGYSQLLLQPVIGLPDDFHIIASATAFLHRGKITDKRLSKVLPSFLTDDSREQIVGLAALVRLATSLPHTCSTLASVNKVDIRDHSVVIYLANADSRSFRRRIIRKSDLWLKVFEKRLEWRFQNNVSLPTMDAPHCNELDISRKTIHTALTNTITDQLAVIIDSADAVCQARDPEAVHDLRVACRRIRSAFRFLSTLLDKSQVRKCQEGLRVCTDHLGAVRNFEVQLDLVANYKNNIPLQEGLLVEPLVQYWGRSQTQARQALISYIEEGIYDSLITPLRELIKTVGKIPLKEKKPHLQNVLAEQSLKLAATRILAFNNELNRASLADLHRLRIQCKRLRYALEFLGTLLCGNSVKVIDRIIAVQTELGTVHDWYVSLAALDDVYSSEHDAAWNQGISNYRVYCYTNLKQAYLRFLDSWRDYATPLNQRNLRQLIKLS